MAHNRLGPSAPCLAASLFGEEDSGQEGKRADSQFCRVTFSAFLRLQESQHNLTEIPSTQVNYIDLAAAFMSFTG